MKTDEIIAEIKDLIGDNDIQASIVAVRDREDGGGIRVRGKYDELVPMVCAAAAAVMKNAPDAIHKISFRLMMAACLRGDLVDLEEVLEVPKGRAS